MTASDGWMFNRRSFLLGASALSACGVREPPPVDFEYVDLRSDRSRFERVIHLSGDSIFRGRALNAFADTVSSDHPLFRFRSIASIANWALQSSGSTDRFAYMFPLPDHGAINADDIRRYVDEGSIRAGDVVAVEDAGGHSQDAAAYEAFWDRVRAAATDSAQVTCLMMDMFEFPRAEISLKGSTFNTNANSARER